MTKVFNKKAKKASRPDRMVYELNPSFEFFDELKNLILKSSPTQKGEMVKKISGLGRVRLAVISGIFMNTNGSDIFESPADLFVVADDINKRRLKTFLASLEADIGKEIKFSMMDKEEFQYRYGMFDRFIRVLLEGPHEKIINKLGL